MGDGPGDGWRETRDADKERANWFLPKDTQDAKSTGTQETAFSIEGKWYTINCTEAGTVELFLKSSTQMSPDATRKLAADLNLAAIRAIQLFPD